MKNNFNLKLDSCISLDYLSLYKGAKCNHYDFTKIIKYIKDLRQKSKKGE